MQTAHDKKRISVVSNAALENTISDFHDDEPYSSSSASLTA